MQPLSGFESRAARSLKIKKLINSLSMSLRNPSALADVPLFLLLRFARYALSPAKSKPYLDLSRLPYPDVKTLLEEMDIDGLMELVGCEAADVTHLDLSNNFLTRMYPLIFFAGVRANKNKRLPSLAYVPISKHSGPPHDFQPPFLCPVLPHSPASSATYSAQRHSSCTPSLRPGLCTQDIFLGHRSSVTAKQNRA